VRDICERYGLPYTTGSLPKQYGKVLRKITRLAFPGGGPKAEVKALPRRPKPVGVPVRLAG
jgi:linoleoyl-CoA desaturase